MANVQYRYKVGKQYRQRTNYINLPTNEYGNILFETLSERIMAMIRKQFPNAVLIWYRILN